MEQEREQENMEDFFWHVMMMKMKNFSPFVRSVLPPYNKAFLLYRGYPASVHLRNFASSRFLFCGDRYIFSFS